MIFKSDMYHTLTNVQTGEPVTLQRPIDNHLGTLKVGLRSITYTVGWYNVGVGESFSWRNSGDASGWQHQRVLVPGIWSFSHLQELLESSITNVSLDASKTTGLITLTIPAGLEVQFTDGLSKALGLDDGQELDAGSYSGDRPVNFAMTRTLHVHLGQINTTHNTIDGAPSTLLTVLGVEKHSFGDIATVDFAVPQYKRLSDGTLGELKVTICDDKGKLIDNHNLPISVVLSIEEGIT